LPDWNTAITKFPVLASSPNHSENKALFKGLYNGNAGWVKPMEAMAVTKLECEKLGVQFVSGLNGTAEELLRADDGKTVIGIRTRDGTEWHADKVIIAAGSYCDTLLDFEGQLQAVSLEVSIFSFYTMSDFDIDRICCNSCANDRSAIPTVQESSSVRYVRTLLYRHI
jgi:sarcosine oxidase / L-pipecolate oxidase